MPIINALADSSFVYATLDQNAKQHKSSGHLLALSNQRIFLPTTTLPEIAFLVRRKLGPHRLPEVIRKLRASQMIWIDPIAADYDRAAEIIERYPEARLDLVDATIAAIAERVKITRILTLDRRDFSVMRPQHCEAFEVLP